LRSLLNCSALPVSQGDDVAANDCLLSPRNATETIRTIPRTIRPFWKQVPALLLFAAALISGGASTSFAQTPWSSWDSLGGGITQIATAVNADGRIEAFAIGTDKALYHIYQTSPGGPWSSWSGLGGAVLQIATAVNADGRIEVFVIATNQALFSHLADSRRRMEQLDLPSRRSHANRDCRECRRYDRGLCDRHRSFSVPHSADCSWRTLERLGRTRGMAFGSRDRSECRRSN
jgi:hypothetical protein